MSHKLPSFPSALLHVTHLIQATATGFTSIALLSIQLILMELSQSVSAYFKEQNSAWETGNRWAVQSISYCLRNPLPGLQSPPQNSILWQLNPDLN
jgi:hypothetical protein